SDQVHLVVVATADRGLCGGFNTNIVRRARRLIEDLLSQGKTVKILCVGRKGRDQLRRTYREYIQDTIEGIGRRNVEFVEADQIATRLTEMFDAGEFDVATIVYARFKSAISDEITVQQIIPAPLPVAGEVVEERTSGQPPALYEYEPSEEAILAEQLQRKVALPSYRAQNKNAASEHGARMNAMDNESHQADEINDRRKRSYNQSRQAQITKEHIEILSGAEAI